MHVRHDVHAYVHCNTRLLEHIILLQLHTWSLIMSWWLSIMISNLSQRVLSSPTCSTPPPATDRRSLFFLSASAKSGSISGFLLESSACLAFTWNEMRLPASEQREGHQIAAGCGHQWWLSLGEWTLLCSQCGLCWRKTCMYKYYITKIWLVKADERRLNMA